ncbi:MAG: YkvA family protein [Bdellovibrionota bacterium]
MLEFFKKIGDFFKEVARDERIPERDKKVLLALLILIVSPLDIIPDWIPVFGMLDDIVMIALVLDYLFNDLDEEILLSHYPFGMKSFARIRAFARTIGMLAPSFLKRRIWKYERSPYRN